jgi:hypothetical protein
MRFAACRVDNLDMTVIERLDELELVRWRIKRLCERRREVALSDHEVDQYIRLTQLEAELLERRGR